MAFTQKESDVFEHRDRIVLTVKRQSLVSACGGVSGSLHFAHPLGILLPSGRQPIGMYSPYCSFQLHVRSTFSLFSDFTYVRRPCFFFLFSHGGNF